MRYRAIGQLRTPNEFRAYLDQLKIDLPFDDQVESGIGSPLNTPYRLPDGFIIGNRFCIQPMEGWDGTKDGRPSDLTFRRWQHFGESGAKLIWGGEAVAVSMQGRANPNQLVIRKSTLPSLTKLREGLARVHHNKYGSSQDLLIGLQLTHSGRFSQPNNKNHPKPIIIYHNPELDRRVGISSAYPVITDDEIDELIERFIQAAQEAQQIGFDFVDIKHCHGYLGHELLSAVHRPGKYGGPFENRTRFLREIIKGIRYHAPGLRIGVRVSIFDMPPFEPHPETGIGRPVQILNHPDLFIFGADPENLFKTNLAEPIQFLDMLRSLDVYLLNLTAGSPYYTPHIQRPARFPPSDGYLPPEDPLVGVARQIKVCADLKKQFPDLAIVGSAYSYLQEYLANVAQYNIRHGRIDFIGLGRQVLSYPNYPTDVLLGRLPDRKKLCRTFSDCTTAPRHGLVSGCYPIDEYYRSRPEFSVLGKLRVGGSRVE